MVLSTNDQLFLKYSRSIAILIIVFGHVGGFWFYEPYSSFFLTVVPVFFFIAGSVAFFSYERSQCMSAYMGKRIISLLVPYYIVCIFALILFVVEGLPFPEGWSALIKWMTLTPTAKKMPFLFGYVWFLRVLLMITVVSPFLFEIHKRNNKFIPRNWKFGGS